MEQSEYREMLLSVADITDDNVAIMKFMCKDFIKKASLEKIQTAQSLYTMLEEHCKLSDDNLSFLKVLLRTARRVDLVQKVEHFELHSVTRTSISSSSSATSSSPVQVTDTGDSNSISLCQAIDLTEEVNFIVENIGKNWRSFIRALGTKDTDIAYADEEFRKVEDRIHALLNSWILRKAGQASRQDIIQALTKCNLHGTARDLDRR